MVIVGGGISGLATAYFLSRAPQLNSIEIVLLEASSRLGGIILTEKIDGFILEGGPDSFVVQKPEALELCRELGLENRLIETGASGRQVYVLWQGKLLPFAPALLLNAPVSITGLCRSPILSWRGKLRAAMEPLLPASNLEDESVADFVCRRLGREVLERMAEPLVAGVYGAHANHLSVRSTFAQLYEAERKWGSVTGGPKKPVRMEGVGTTKSPFLSLTSGMGELIEALTASIKNRVALRMRAKVSGVDAASRGYHVHIQNEVPCQADAVVLATPAQISAGLLSGPLAAIGELLREIPYAPAIIVCLGFDEDVLRGRAGSGFLVPKIGRRTILACTWVDRKFPHRCSPGSTLLRCFVSCWDGNDESLLEAVKAELKQILGVQRAPVLQRAYRWESALPQYLPGHHSRMERLTRRLQACSGLYCAGNFIDGVGISDCVRHARKAAQAIAQG